MIRYRPFRNTDPNGLTELWRAGGVGRSVMQPMTTELWEEHIFAKPYFDRLGLIVAEDEKGRLVGCVHAGFGPTADGADVAYDPGVVSVLIVRPEYRGKGVAAKLLEEAEKYLHGRGSKAVYAGAFYPLNPFYLGLYGGSNMPGILDSVTGLGAFYESQGYRSAGRVLVFERDLTKFEPSVDRNYLVVRRSTTVLETADPPPATWWDACVLSNAERYRYTLHSKPRVATMGPPTTPPMAFVKAWMIEPLSRSWGKRAAGVSRFEVDEKQRRNGLATYLLSVTFERLREKGVSLVQAQARAEDEAVIKLYEKLGLEQKDAGTIFVKSLTGEAPTQPAAPPAT